jgi:hypothetical protein
MHGHTLSLGGAGMPGRSCGNRRGFLRGLGFLVLIAICLFAAYSLASGDVATMTAAFLRRVRAMGQP